MLPEGENGQFTLKEVGMLASTIENIDFSLTSWIKKDMDLQAHTNEGFTQVPVIWQTPERAYQVKHKKELRDDGGALKLPIISVERTGITKDPTKRGTFQANYYSKDKNGRSGRFVLAKRIVPDKTRNFATVGNTRTNLEVKNQLYYPRKNKKVVVQTLSIPLPVYINIDYKIVIKSEYQQQMNSLVSPQQCI
mgnify:FL=1